MTALILALSILLAAIAGILWGIVQGMVMIRLGDRMFNLQPIFDDGVRGHRWFSRFHFLFGALVFSLVLWGRIVPLDPWIIGLSLLIGWAFSEPCYNYARYRSINSPYGDNVTFFDIKVKIPWLHKVTWTETEKADKPTYEISSDADSMTVSVNNVDEWEITKSKWEWHWIQIMPFHAPSKAMNLIRIGIVAIAGLVMVIKRKEKP